MHIIEFDGYHSIWQISFWWISLNLMNIFQSDEHHSIWWISIWWASIWWISLSWENAQRSVKSYINIGPYLQWPLRSKLSSTHHSISNVWNFSFLVIFLCFSFPAVLFCHPLGDVIPRKNERFTNNTHTHIRKHIEMDDDTLCSYTCTHTHTRGDT